MIDALQRIPNHTVLVIGDAMLDHYVWGEVNRISPEAPVPIVHVRKETFRAGGSANVALNLASLGVHTRLLSAWGIDSAGKQLSELLCESNVDCEHCVASSTLSTIVKKRVIARTQQLCRVDYEGPQASYSEASKDKIELLQEAMTGCDAVIVSDYAKGLISQTFLDDILALAKSLKIRVAVDPKPSRLLNIQAPWLLTPNRSEALVLAGLPDGFTIDDRSVEEVCQRIRDRYSPEVLVLTLGAEGMALSEPKREVELFPTAAREVYDVSGAGDTVISTLVAASVSGADLKTSVLLANLAAGCVVAHLGTVPITMDELRDAVKSSIMN
jgi:rfaE bifunctional protein kinase chain/domain